MAVLTVFAGPPLRWELTYDEVSGDVTAATGTNLTAVARYTVTITPPRGQSTSVTYEPGVLNADGSVTPAIRTDAIPKGRAKYATVEAGALAFDGSITLTGVRV